jgi:phosphoribosylaminoimidazole-succinocarboxamide synthase
VRGYITGSAWVEYKNHGTVHGIQMPPNLKECSRLDPPIWTPSTKAEQGAHDENLRPDQAVDELLSHGIGNGDRGVAEKVAREVERVSLDVYRAAHSYALEKGIVIADTKFEFALAKDSTDDVPKVVLIDEVLTPDSSRFWPRSEYEEGRAQKSFDKQALRDWLVSSGLKGKEGVRMTEEVVMMTAEKYEEAFEMLTGKTLEA